MFKREYEELGALFDLLHHLPNIRTGRLAMRALGHPDVEATLLLLFLLFHLFLIILLLYIYFYLFYFILFYFIS